MRQQRGTLSCWCLAAQGCLLTQSGKLLGDVDYYPVRKYTEIELHTSVRNALAHVDIQFQFYVGEYKS